MTPFEEYVELEDRLRAVRRANDNRETLEEETLLDKMDLVWLQLTSEEHQLINERPACW